MDLFRSLTASTKKTTPALSNFKFNRSAESSKLTAKTLEPIFRQVVLDKVFAEISEVNGGGKYHSDFFQKGENYSKVKGGQMKIFIEQKVVKSGGGGGGGKEGGGAKKKEAPKKKKTVKKKTGYHSADDFIDDDDSDDCEVVEVRSSNNKSNNSSNSMIGPPGSAWSR